jgi:hypothetical protein
MVFLGSKNYKYAPLGAKAAQRVMALGSKIGGHAAGGSKRIATLPTGTGRGETGVGGPTIHGNTPHPIANSQRDGQMRDMRSGGVPGKRAPGKSIESRKRNKVG